MLSLCVIWRSETFVRYSSLLLSWWMLILGILPSKECCSQNLAVNSKLPFWVVISCTGMYCQGDEGTEHHWPWKKSGRYRRCWGAWSGNICSILLERLWALNYLLLLVLYAVSEVLTKLLNQMNKDKSCCTFFFSGFAGSICKSLLWNVVWGLKFGG